MDGTLRNLVGSNLTHSREVGIISLHSSLSGWALEQDPCGGATELAEVQELRDSVIFG